MPVRSLYVDRPAEVVAERVRSRGTALVPVLRPQADATGKPARREGLTVIHALQGDDLLIGAVHPMNASRSALHLVIVGDAEKYRGAGQLHFSRFAETLRDSIESRVPA